MVGTETEGFNNEVGMGQKNVHSPFHLECTHKVSKKVFCLHYFYIRLTNHNLPRLFDCKVRSRFSAFLCSLFYVVSIFFLTPFFFIVFLFQIGASVTDNAEIGIPVDGRFILGDGVGV